MEDTMNWWLLVYLGLVALNQVAYLGTARDRHDFWGKIIGIPLSWGLLYMAGVFSLL